MSKKEKDANLDVLRQNTPVEKRIQQKDKLLGKVWYSD